MITTDYDNIVVIDSQVVLEAKPLDQLPWGELFEGSILLIVVRQVQTEIDRKKSDGRLGKRARSFNKLLDGFIESRTPSNLKISPKIDIALSAHRTIAWQDFDGLDPDDGDDRIVAQALNAKIDDSSRLVLLSHDLWPRHAAATFGLKAVKLPDTWLNAPEPSPHERRLKELEEKVKLLEADQPKLRIRLQEITAKPWCYSQVLPPRVEQIEEILNRRIANAPQQYNSGPFDLGLRFEYDFSHEGKVAAWETDIREDISLIHDGLTKLYAQHRIRVSIENYGTISAEGLSLEIRSGNASLHSSPYWVFVDGPPAPHPRPFLLSSLVVSSKDLVPLRREQFKFYWEDDGPGDHVILSCQSFRQSKSHVFEISVELHANTPPKAQIQAIATATNMKGDVREQLLIDVESTSIPFDDAFDSDTEVLKIPPSIVFPTFDEADEYTWLRNNGVEWTSY
ncbi:MAG: PIN domain-containing protein [Salipiger marinus]|uniref:PIN domain-containing protein n=1 Tax=Salipiger marinus TaxID=555512 RepID=UPI0040597419